MEHTVWLLPEHIATEIRNIYELIEKTGNLSTRVIPPMIILPPHLTRESLKNSSLEAYTFGTPEVREERLFIPILPNLFSPTGIYSSGVYLCTAPSQETIQEVVHYLQQHPLQGGVKKISPNHKLITENPIPWASPQQYEIHHYRGDQRKTEKPVDLH